MMAAIGIRQDHIAKIIGICDNVLRGNYREELDLGASKVGAMIAGNLVRQALKDDFRAAPSAMFYAKTQMGWRETIRQEQTGADGGPIKEERTVVILPANGRE